MEILGTLGCMVLIGIIVIGGIFFAMYNSLIGKRNNVDQAFASIDVMLKKRYDLIPNLVATAEQYMQHERGLLNEITELRTRAITGDVSVEERVDTENKINNALGRLMVSVENYPDLKANENFLMLQRSLNEVEEQISAARRSFNAAVTDYNNAVEMMPTSLIAQMMGMQKRPWFEATEVERQNVDIRSEFQR